MKSITQRHEGTKKIKDANTLFISPLCLCAFVRVSSCIVVFLFLASPVFSASLDELAGVERAVVLRAAAEPLTEVQLKAPSPRLLPQHTALERFIADIQSGLEPNMLVETLSLYRKPNAANWDKAEQTSLLNQLTALSTLAGIQYYSESRKTLRTFYETSQVIDDATSKTPQPDPVYAALPESLTLYARQKDLTFGDNIYRFTFNTGGDFIFFVQENLTSMNAGIFPAIGKNKLHSVIAVIDSGDSLLIYAAAMAKTVAVPGMGDRIGHSFTNRAKAILQWFTGRAGEVFK